MSKSSIIEGVVQHVPMRTDGYMDGVVRLQVFDEEGNVAEVVPVQVRGLPHGIIADGDRLEIVGIKKSDGVLRPTHLRNLTTGSEHRRPRWLGAVILTVVLGLFILFMAAMFLIPARG